MQDSVFLCRISVAGCILMSQFNMGAFKQTLLAINNEVNNEVFGRGLHSQRVFINETAIVIVSINLRVPALATLDATGVPTREIDLVLIDAHKKRLKQLIQERIHLSVVSVLKDYDPKNQISVNIIILDKPLSIED